MKPIKNRETAGKLLAEKIKSLDLKNFSILALPRGGVPVAWALAKELNLCWDILLVKKIGAPGQPEFAIGAVSEDKRPIWDAENIALLGMSENELSQLAEKSVIKILDQARKWRNGRAPLSLKGQNIIIVDDGLATGLTMLSAVEFLKHKGVNKIIIAVPVASKSSKDLLSNKVNHVVVLETPEPFFAVGQWYEDFNQVTDENVTNLLDGNSNQEEILKANKIKAVDIHFDGDVSLKWQ